MKLWVLTRYIDPDKSGGWGYTNEMVVRAEDIKSARELAAEKAKELDSSEGPECWLDAELSACKELRCSGEARVVCIDYHEP